MDQAATLRNLMSERGGDPLARLSLYPRTQFFMPIRMKDAGTKILTDLATVLAEREKKTVLIVDGFQPQRRLEKVRDRLYAVGSEKLSLRLDEDTAVVLGIGRVIALHPYLESETDLKRVSQGASSVVVHGAGDEALVDAYRQMRTLSSRFAVKKVDTLMLGPCGVRDAVRVHARLEEMGNRFLHLELGFLGNLKVNPAEILIHFESGDSRAQLELIASKFVSQPAQKAQNGMTAKDLGEVRQ